MKALKKDPIHKKIMATRDDYVNNDIFDPDEAVAAAVDKRTFLLQRLYGRSRTFSRTINPKNYEKQKNYCFDYTERL